MSQTKLGDEWDQIETMGDVSVALPGEPERLTVGEGPGAGQLVVADEFGDAFALFDGTDEQLAAALAYALDQLYGTEWGTAAAPSIDPASGQASFEAFGERYLALWRRRPSKVLLLAVVRPEREPRATAFVEGGSERS